MPTGTVEEFLRVASMTKGAQFIELWSNHSYFPGQRNGSLNQKSRLGTKENPKPTPYKRVVHTLRRSVLLGADYGSLVNKQREKEATAAIAALELPSYLKLNPEIEEFIPEKLWFGKGERDDEFPRLAAKHKDNGNRYLCFWPATYQDGTLMPQESHYYDQDGRELDFETEVAEYWKKKPEKSKVQGTEREIFWGTVKFSNVVKIHANRLVWTFEPEPEDECE